MSSTRTVWGQELQLTTNEGITEVKGTSKKVISRLIGGSGVVAVGAGAAAVTASAVGGAELVAVGGGTALGAAILSNPVGWVVGGVGLVAIGGYCAYTYFSDRLFALVNSTARKQRNIHFVLIPTIQTGTVDHTSEQNIGASAGARAGVCPAATVKVNIHGETNAKKRWKSTEVFPIICTTIPPRQYEKHHLEKDAKTKLVVMCTIEDKQVYIWRSTNAMSGYTYKYDDSAITGTPILGKRPFDDTAGIQGIVLEALDTSSTFFQSGRVSA